MSAVPTVVGSAALTGRARLTAVVRPDPWRVPRIALLVGYAVLYLAWFKAKGIVIDRVSVLLSVLILFVIANVGRPINQVGRGVLDFAFYASMWIAYDESRGIADRLGFPLQVESVINMDKFLFFGGVPNVWMQERFYEPGSVRWYDVAGSLVYFSHFIGPPAVMVILYLANRREWLRFVKRFATTMFIACTMFIVLPTAPPWMAAGGDREIILNELPPLRRPTARGWSHLGLKSFANAWDAVKGRDWANKVAALPSLHAGYALFVVAFLLPWIRPRWLKVLVFAWPLAMTAALVYFGEHYVVDALAGWAVVGISFLVWNRIEQRQRDRRLTTTCGALAASHTTTGPR